MRGKAWSLLLEPQIQGEQQDPGRESILTRVLGDGREGLG